jgi:hypothetical protein
VSRELWLRTQNERAFRRFWVIPGTTTVEIEEVARDGYRNPHYRKEYWEKAPYRVEILFEKEGKGESNSQKTP